MDNKQNIACSVGTPELLVEYSAGRLADAETIRLDRHTGGCAHCQDFLLTQRSVWEALDGYQQVAPPVSSDFDRQLYARIAAEQQDSWWVRGWRRLMAAGEPLRWTPALSMAAACVVLMTGLLVRVDDSWGAMPAGAKIASARKAVFEKQDIETIERALEDFEMLNAMGAPGTHAEAAAPGKL